MLISGYWAPVRDWSVPRPRSSIYPAEMAGDGSEREFDRFITFLDAVVAIAITLLVLTLVELTADVGDYRSVLELVRTNQEDLWAFILSFAVISRFWFAQHATVRHVRRFDRRVAGLLMTWSGTIVFLAFPTALVAEAGEDSATKILYVGTMATTMLLLTLVEWYLRRHPEITDEDPVGDLDPKDGLVNVVVLVLALVVMLALPTTSYLPLLLLLVAGPVAARWRKAPSRGRPSSPLP